MINEYQACIPLYEHHVCTGDGRFEHIGPVTRVSKVDDARYLTVSRSTR